MNDELYRELTKDLDRTSNGVPYHWWLAGPEGGHFMLFLNPNLTRSGAEGARNELRRDRDVVSFRKPTMEDWYALYRNAVFAHPDVKKFKWYEVNIDDIETEYRKGTTVDNYVKGFVLPHRESTKQKIIERNGVEALNW